MVLSPDGSQATGDARLRFSWWCASAIVLCVWMMVFFVSMNWQIRSGIKMVCQTKEMAALGLAVLLVSAPRTGRLPPLFVFAFLAMLAVGWFWGLNDTFYKDGVLTVARAQAVMEGKSVSRFSLSYLALGMAFRFLGNYNWVGHLYVMLVGLGLLYLMSRTFRDAGSRLLVVMMALFSPHLFVLAKLLYLDIPVITGFVATVLSYSWAMRRPSFGRCAISIAVLVVTVLLKEAGIIAVIPVLFLPFLAPRGKRTRILLLTLASCAAALPTFWVLYTLARERQGLVDQRVIWLLFNTNACPVGVSVKWFFSAARNHFRAAAWWGFLLFALIGLVRGRDRMGRGLLAGILLCQLILMAAAHQFDVGSKWNYRPLVEPHADTITDCMVVMVLVLMGFGLLTRSLALRRLRRLDGLSWIFLLAAIFVFSALAKVEFKDGRATPKILLDWRYLSPAIAFLLLLAARGAARLFSSRHPLWFRALAGVALAMSLEFCALRAVDVAAFFSTKARANGEAYRVVQRRPERVVFSRWPFFMGAGSQCDYGEMRWQSDGFKLRDISELDALRRQPKERRERIQALVVQSEDQYLGRWMLFPETVFDERAKIRYPRPFDFRVRKAAFHRIYVGKVRFE